MKRTLKSLAVGFLMAAVVSGAAVAFAGPPLPQGPKVVTTAVAQVRSAVITAQNAVEVGNVACPNVPSTDPESWSYRVETVMRRLPQTQPPRVCVVMVRGRSSQSVPPVQKLDQAAAFVHSQAAKVENAAQNVARTACSLRLPPQSASSLPPQCSSAL